MEKMDSKIKVGKWTLSPHLCELFDGEKTIHLEPKSMELLLLLAHAKGDLVTRKQIMDVVWKDRVVTEYALNNLISGLRKHLNEKGTPEAYIATKPKLGYQLIAPVCEFIDESLSQEPSAKAHKSVESNSTSSTTNTLQSNSSEQVVAGNTTVKNTKKKSYLIPSIAIVLIVFATFTWWSNTEVSKETLSPSIVVLPFDVFDSDEDIGYFADGLAEEIIHQLTVLQNLKVISRTSSFYFRDKDLPLTDIAEKLDVSYVLEGSVRKAGDTMRVTLQLIKAKDDTHVWSKVFTASKRNRFSIQHEISTEVAHSIDASFIEIPLEKRIFAPNSSEAYLRVLKGRKLNQKGTPDAHIQARDEFLMATLLEPEYADAYVNLGVSYLLLIKQNRLKKEDAMEHATKAIARALELDPNLDSAYAAKGVMHQMNNQIDAAQSAFKKALEINPDLYLALINYANFFRNFSRYQDALAHYERAKEVAPLSGAAQWGLGSVLLRLGRLEDSVDQYKQCISLLTDHVNCHYGYAYTLRLSDKSKEADKILVKLSDLANPDDFWFQSITGFHNLWQGNFEAANTNYENMISQYGLNNDFVLSMPTLKLWLNEIDDWTKRLETRLANNTDNKANVSVHLSYAVSAYYNQQCKPAIETFEKVLKYRPHLFEELEALVTAYNYSAMLAYCYQQEGLANKHATSVALSEKVIGNIPETSQNIGGFLYTAAQTAMVKGDVEQAERLLAKLRASNWQLKWLIKEDPILSAINSSNIALNN
ncbi:winged helix-turn-helix domain-containing protein [Glaciecola petra]|uniref:Winged helix-turn-helix domain-containing protein n=1 Tax=Glaciecola petra TaxID=3075602 RepID=A0ABU2ZTG4_9ALTE|nr:winged helix-turn-helix domain-containing protein [Aestuariibacter sp. P117]MDT0595932.1 winged helix-turn-helix domain-containing protein [Aestuariibacter sp. P117]